jgi:hypothetical protein
MEPLKPQSINYKKIEQVSGKYRFNRVSMNNLTGSNVPLTNNSSVTIEFKLPVGVYNLSRSFISYVNNVNAVTASTYVYDNTLSIASSIQFGTSGGLNLCDVQYANNYINLVRPIDTPIDVFLSNDNTTGLYPITPANAITANSNNVFPQSFAVNGTNPYNMPTTTQLLNPVVNGICAVRQSVATTSPVVNSTIFPLSGVTNTILAMDKDQYFPDNMYLRILTALSGKVAYQAANVNDGSTTPANISVQPTLNNVYLYLAMEKDQLIIDSLHSKYASGNLKYQIPYVIAYRNQVLANTSTIQIQLNSGNGKKLKRVITSFYNTDETTWGTKSNLAYDHSNVNAIKCTSYQTYIDNMPLQDSIMSCALPTALLSGMDDWRENKQICKGSAIKNSLEYNQNWFHADRFNEKNENTDIQSDNIDEGLSLATPKAWSIQANMAVPAVNYTFCNVIRDLSISSAGVLFI